jgi:mannose-6-phosphate isomerase-like protein (cupin superfamily)
MKQHFVVSDQMVTVKEKKMAILVNKFDPATADKDLVHFILASDVLPTGMKAPFKHKYGYLENNQTMAGHAHATDEIYIVFSGTGYVTVGGENCAIGPGDVIAIPPNQWHTMMCTDKDIGPLLWAALWWEKID